MSLYINKLNVHLRLYVVSIKTIVSNGSEVKTKALVINSVFFGGRAKMGDKGQY